VALSWGPLVDVLSINDLRGIKWGDTRLVTPPRHQSRLNVLTPRDAGESVAKSRPIRPRPRPVT